MEERIKDFLELAVEQSFDAHKAKVERITALRALLPLARKIEKRYGERFGAVLREFVGYRDALEIHVEVASFRDILPLLEYVEKAGVKIDSSTDWPAYSERSYISDAGIVITAELKNPDDAEAKCRRVVTGWRTPPPQPQYEFVCN